MLWLGRRARDLLARVPALAHNAHQKWPRCPDDQVGGRGYSLFSHTNSSTVPDISHAGTERKAHAHRAALPHPTGHDEQLICAWMQQHLPQRPVDKLVYHMVPHQSASALAATELVDAVHDAARLRGSGAQFRANVAAQTLQQLVQQPHIVEYLKTDMQLSRRLLQALARCGPLPPRAIPTARPLLVSLAAGSGVHNHPPSVVCDNVSALVVLGVPVEEGCELEVMLTDALDDADMDDMIQLLWYERACGWVLSGCCVIFWQRSMHTMSAIIIDNHDHHGHLILLLIPKVVWSQPAHQATCCAAGSTRARRCCHACACA